MMRLILAGVIAVTSLFSSALVAENTSWDFDLAPYVWALNVNGDSQFGNLQSEVDIGFDQILENLDMAAMVHMEARKDRWLLFGDLVYGKITIEDAVPPLSLGPFNIGNQTFGPFAVTPDVEVEGKMTFLEAAIGYAIKEAAKPTDWSIYLYGGARYSAYDAEISFKRLDRKVSLDTDWVDPIVGIKARKNLSDNWHLLLSGDIGGFGIGSASDSSASGHIIFSYNWKDKTKLLLGYKALYQDYTTGSGSRQFTWDGTMHGPVIGLNIKF
jgi:hypothetical protein